MFCFPQHHKSAFHSCLQLSSNVSMEDHKYSLHSLMLHSGNPSRVPSHFVFWVWMNGEPVPLLILIFCASTHQNLGPNYQQCIKPQVISLTHLQPRFGHQRHWHKFPIALHCTFIYLYSNQTKLIHWMTGDRSP